ncbi:spore germination protein [Paenibacillus chitinolyticus]|uniref:Spore germination protein n=2 Tax=Paenibacillus chitinolyticus TaxID=79263 RepID=A0A410WVA1_9BACL|nr:spore germination protein [Paenibacillus chitinolyticus]QAV18253.1 spore germination protein [Paenibacillus chitinolyticus]
MKKLIGKMMVKDKDHRHGGAGGVSGSGADADDRSKAPALQIDEEGNVFAAPEMEENTPSGTELNEDAGNTGREDQLQSRANAPQETPEKEEPGRARQEPAQRAGKPDESRRETGDDAADAGLRTGTRDDSSGGAARSGKGSAARKGFRAAGLRSPEESQQESQGRESGSKEQDRSAGLMEEDAFGIKKLLRDGNKGPIQASFSRKRSASDQGGGEQRANAEDHSAAADVRRSESTGQQKQASGGKGDKQGQKGKGPSNGDESKPVDDPIPLSMQEVKDMLEERSGLGTSFDLVLREMVFGSIRVGFYYVNGLAKDQVLTMVLDRLSYADHAAMEQNPAESLKEYLIPHIQVSPYQTMKEVIGQVMAGATGVFIEGEKTALAIDAKNFPVRSTEEPDLERVVRGSRDGFVETLMTNVALVRRRVRDPKLRAEIMQVGKRTSTDICIGYIEDIANPKLVEAIRDKVKSVELDGIPLAEKQLEEAIVAKGWNPYPLVRYTERPDVAAAHLLEGHVILMSDTSPSVMIMPSTFFHHLQHAEEYRQLPIIGSYLRWVRFLGILASLFLLPLWYLMVLEPGLKPTGLEFIGPQHPGQIPVLIQFLLAELGIDLMRMASVHTPTPLSVAMGLVAAILIGDIAVKTGLFTNEIIFYISIATIGMFATPSYELSLANRIVRLILLFSVALFKVPGLVIATTVWLMFLSLQRSHTAPYMWPFLPFNAMGLMNILFRLPVLKNKTRLSITRSKDGTRQPAPE